MRKYTKAEGYEALSPKAHEEVEKKLKSFGKTSARGLSDSQRQSLQDVVDESENR